MSGRRMLIVAVIGMLAAPAAGFAQASQRQQGVRQQDRMQQHVQQMDEQLQRMDRIRDRLHQFEQECVREIQRTRDQDRLHEQERLRDMAHAMNSAAVQMKENMERTREMAQNRMFQNDPELQQEMERLRNHWRDMLGRMEEGVGVMERIQKRITAAR